MIPSSLSVGLKEWATVCAAVGDGTQILLLRKGGIHESAGEFELEHPAFLLFPTYLHQKPEMLKDSARAGLAPASAEPQTITLATAGLATDIIRLQSRRQMDALDEEHIWTAPLIDMRFNYRPENPLYLILVRAWRLPEPVSIDNTLEYAGCKSWVPLTHPVATGGATAVLDDDVYQTRCRLIRERLGA